MGKPLRATLTRFSCGYAVLCLAFIIYGSWSFSGEEPRITTYYLTIILVALLQSPGSVSALLALGGVLSVLLAGYTGLREPVRNACAAKREEDTTR